MKRHEIFAVTLDPRKQTHVVLEAYGKPMTIDLMVTERPPGKPKTVVVHRHYTSLPGALEGAASYIRNFQRRN